MFPSFLRRYIGFTFPLVAVFILLWQWNSATPAAPEPPGFPHDTLVIRATDGTRHSFAIEVATSEAQQEYGLMFRRDLAADAGMLFVYDPPQPIAMWMKNTYVPLDMIYVRANGVIAKIIANAKPFDLTPLYSDENVAGVIEIKGGEAARRGIQVGDAVLHGVFHPAPTGY